MRTRTGTSSSHDPASEPAIDQSAQSASGLSTGRRARGVSRRDEPDEDVVNRHAPDSTPRRYEQPIEEDA